MRAITEQKIIQIKEGIKTYLKKIEKEITLCAISLKNEDSMKQSSLTGTDGLRKLSFRKLAGCMTGLFGSILGVGGLYILLDIFFRVVYHSYRETEAFKEAYGIVKLWQQGTLNYTWDVLFNIIGSQIKEKLMEWGLYNLVWGALTTTASIILISAVLLFITAWSIYCLNDCCRNIFGIKKDVQELIEKHKKDEYEKKKLEEKFPERAPQLLNYETKINNMKQEHCRIEKHEEKHEEENAKKIKNIQKSEQSNVQDTGKIKSNLQKNKNILEIDNMLLSELGVESS